MANELKQLWLIDIDGTICEDIPNEKYELFSSAQPINGALEMILELKKEGGRITYFTARTSEHAEVTEAWLKKHGWNPEDPALTLGHPLIARVNVEESFGTDDFAYGQKVLADHLDVYSIKCDQTGYNIQECLYDYRWSDPEYDQSQMKLL